MTLCETCKNRGLIKCQKNTTIQATTKAIPKEQKDDPSLQAYLEFVKQNAEAEARRRGCPNI
jgi:hypothetical protein